MIDLKQRRIELGLTMLEVAKKVGVSEATISRYESGNIQNMRRNRIKLYAEALQVPPSVFTDDEKNALSESTESDDDSKYTLEQVVSAIDKLPTEQLLEVMRQTTEALQERQANQDKSDS